MRQVALPDGTQVPALGLGTWRMGESSRSKAAEVAALREALDLGYRLIDTAEMYGEGGAETLIGQAVAQALRGGSVRRDELFIVSKVYPHNGSREGVVAACERSLKRLQLEHVDLYLLHWPGSHPLSQTVDGFERLRERGFIARWGVSNFDAEEMAALWRVRGGPGCAVNQVYYSLSQRGVEFDLLPWQRERGVPTMAYSPIDQGELAGSAALKSLARRLDATTAQLALAWLLQRGDTIAIPKAVRTEHLRENFAAASIEPDGAALAELDRLFPPPRGRQPLAML